ncbi:aspartate/glutamate racemase family protein [Paraburkholderia xenovorans]|nr:aspartate/glutamate racemase family protein [Paraburkholderia xenovorans]
MPRLALINPNTSEASTRLMVGIAAAEAGETASIAGFTARFGSPLISCEAHLRVAAEAVLDLIDSGVADGFDGVIISAFGDPGVEAVRARVPMPVLGLAEASLAEAAAFGGKFAIGTTTPQLIDAIERYVMRRGFGAQLRAIRTTSGDFAEVMADAERMEAALAVVIETIIQRDDVCSIIIGGGPLAGAARTLAVDSPTRIIEPIPAAVRGLLAQLNGARV